MSQWKIVFAFNLDGQGFSESYFYETPGTRDFAVVDTAADTLETARQALNGTQTLLKFRRTELMDSTAPPAPAVQNPTRPSALRNNLSIGTQRGKSGSDSLDPLSGFLINLYDRDVTVRRSLILKGLAKEYFLWNPASPVSQTPPAVMMTALNQFIAVLGAVTSPPLITETSRWKIVGRGTPDKQAVMNIQLAAGPGSQWIVTIADTPAVGVGDIIHIYNARGCTLKGLSGDHVVEAVSVNETFPNSVDVLLITRQCCRGAIKYNSKAKWVKVERDTWTGIARAEFGRTTWRKSGAAFSSTRGRRSASCRG